MTAEPEATETEGVGPPEVTTPATGEKQFSARHQAVDLGPAKWVLLGAFVLCVVSVAWHVKQVLELEPEDLTLAGFQLDTIQVPSDSLIQAARPGSFPIMPSDPPMLRPDEVAGFKLGRSKFIVRGDPVLGVVIGGHARAYPIRLLDFHEVINDTVNDVPIAVTWSPLSGSAAVFLRRVEGSRLELKPSGLLSNSSALLQDGNRPRSLWSQVLGRAVAGPAGAQGLKLERVPFKLIRWEDWHAEHPGSLVLMPAPEFTKVYKTSPYRAYLGSDTLRFPVAPLPPVDAGEAEGIKLRKKTPVLAVTAGGKRLVYPFPLVAKRAGESGLWETTQGGVPLQIRYWAGNRADNPTIAVVTAPGGEPLEVLPSFWFAWYATHPGDELAR